MATKQKFTIYFPEDMLEETRHEAMRQDRTVSWILQKAWLIARRDIQHFPAADETWRDVPEPIVMDALSGK